MHVSTSVLYELVFAAALLLLAGLSAAVIFGLRFLLRGWTSRWPKTLVAHAANFLVALFGFPLVVRILPLDEYLGITHGGLLTFWLACLIADGVRIGWQRTASPSRWQGIAVVLLILVSGVASTRVTALAAENKQALETTRLSYAIVAKWRQKLPEREVLAAMSTNFLPEFNETTDRYLTKAIGERAGRSGPHAVPPFPYGEVSQFLGQHRKDIARAPDAELVSLARTMAGMAAVLEDEELRCDPFALSVSMNPSYARQPANPANLQAMSRYIVAGLTAARAGIDSPVERTFPAARSAELARRLAQAVPTSQHLPATRQAADSASCKMIASELRWIGGLPPDDAAYALAWLFSSEPDAR